MTGQVVPVKLNAEKDGKDVAQQYKVQGYPTILFIDSAGKVQGKIGGYEPAEGFSQDLTRIVSGYRELPGLEARHKSNPHDAAASAKLAVTFAGQGQVEQAQALLDQAASADPDNGTGELAKAYNALGDCYQNDGKFDRAIPLFERAAKLARTSYERAYANISAAVCYFSEQKPAQAKPYLNAVIADDHAPAEYRTQAKQMLDAIAKQGGGH